MTDGPEKIVLHRGGWRPVKPGDDPPYDETLYVRGDIAAEHERQRDQAVVTLRQIVAATATVAPKYGPGREFAEVICRKAERAIVECEEGTTPHQELREITGWGSDSYPENQLSGEEVDKVLAEIRRRGIEIAVGTDGMAGDPTWLCVKIDGRLVMHQRFDRAMDDG